MLYQCRFLTGFCRLFTFAFKNGKIIKVINRISNVTEVYSRALAYETEYVVDPELPEGETRILIAGSEGEELCTATVTYEDGREISRSVVTSKVILAPVNQVVAVGSAVAPEAVSGELYIGNGVIITADGDVLTYVDEISSLATAYTCEGWGRPGITATGTIARVGEIAVDPKYIPYGTRVFIVSEDGEYVYGVATAEDTAKVADIDLTDKDFWRGALQMIADQIDLFCQLVAE